MKSIPKFYGSISKDGKLLIKDTERFSNYLIYQLAGKEIELEIAEKLSKRTLSQNALYWAYLTLIEEETGENANDLHEIFKRQFLPPVYKTVLGKEYKLPASTTKLSKADFTDYLDKICAETNVPIPCPEYHAPIKLKNYPENNLSDTEF